MDTTTNTTWTSTAESTAMTTNSKAWFCFSSGNFYCDNPGDLTQQDVDAVWRSLPMTGCSWIEHGEMYVQERAGASAFCLGQVEGGIVRANRS